MAAIGVLSAVCAVTAQAALTDEQVEEAIALGQRNTDLSVRVGTFSAGSVVTTCSVIVDGPMARIAAAASSATRAYRPFSSGNVTAGMRARTFVVAVRTDRGAGSCGVRHIVLQPTGATGLEGAVQPIREGSSEAVFDQLPPGDIQVVVAIASGAAPKVRVSPKDRARLEYAAGLVPASPARAPAPASAVATPSPSPTNAKRELRLIVSGDAKHAADAIVALRAELQVAGLSVTVVSAGDVYDYHVVFGEGDRNAGAAMAIDAGGSVVAMAVRAGFTEKGAAESAARDLAKKLSALSR